MKKYFPYKSDRPEKKFYIITRSGKKVYFGDSKFEQFTVTPYYNGHLDWKRQQAYERRHQKNEDWHNPDTAGYWSYWYLWKYPTYLEGYDKIQKDLKSKGYL